MMQLCLACVQVSKQLTDEVAAKGGDTTEVNEADIEAVRQEAKRLRTDLNNRRAGKQAGWASYGWEFNIVKFEKLPKPSDTESAEEEEDQPSDNAETDSNGEAD